MPDLLADQTELQRLQEAIERAPRTGQTEPPPHQRPAQLVLNVLSMVTFAQTPVSEWQGKCMFRMTSPLFPNGLGDFYLPRREEITLQEWVRQSIR